VIIEEEWARIISAFPEAHQATVRTKIEAAREDYLRDQRQKPGEQRKLWQRIAKLLNSAAVTELCQLVPRVDLNELPDPGFIDPLAPDHNWLPQMTEYLSQGRKIVKAYADLSKPRERLYARLFRIWTEASLELSTSAVGPLVRFVQDVTNDLFPTPITGEAIKKAVPREHARRRIKALAMMIKIKTSVTADATIIKLDPENLSG
jgi:hypothetical protein